MRPIITLAFLCCTLFGCESTKNTNGNAGADKSLEGTWDLQYIAGKENTFSQLFPGNKPFIKFDVSNKKISGKTGCNSFSGALVTKDTSIDFTGPIAMTKMYCDGGGESVFTQALTKVTSFNVSDSILELRSGDTVSMRLRKRLQ